MISRGLIPVWFPPLILLLCLAFLGTTTWLIGGRLTANQEAQTATALVSDLDNDGLKYEEELAFRCNPDVPDSDADGLRDGDEKTWGSDCNVRDSDHDNLSDGEEVQIRKTNPMNPDTDGDSIPDNTDPDPGKEISKLLQMEGLPTYKITSDEDYNDGQEPLGIDMIAFTSNPAVMVKGVAFTSQKKVFFSDDLKYRITAPAMIPMEIYRRDQDMGEYYVQFTEEEIDTIHKEFMSDLKNRDIFNLEHNAEQKVPAYLLEAWIVDNPKEDKSYSTFGIDVPKGTLMVTAQITDRE